MVYIEIKFLCFKKATLQLSVHMTYDNNALLPREARKELPHESACSPDLVSSSGVFSLCLWVSDTWKTIFFSWMTWEGPTAPWVWAPWVHVLSDAMLPPCCSSRCSCRVWCGFYSAWCRSLVLICQVDFPKGNRKFLGRGAWSLLHCGVPLGAGQTLGHTDLSVKPALEIELVRLKLEPVKSSEVVVKILVSGAVGICQFS